MPIERSAKLVAATWPPQPPEPADDVRRLHAILLASGGFADRRSLLWAMDWTAERLATTVNELRGLLDPLGERLIELPDGILELRSYRDSHVERAVRAISTRDAMTTGLTPATAQIVYRLRKARRRVLPLRTFQTPDEIDAMLDLEALGAIQTHEGNVELTPRARADLAGDIEIWNPDDWGYA